MNRILIATLLALCVGTAFAQSASVAATSGKDAPDATIAAQTAAEKSADAFCLRETGSHMHAITKNRNEHAVECANAPGRAYTRADLERTGATTTSEALRRLDPSIH